MNKYIYAYNYGVSLDEINDKMNAIIKNIDKIKRQAVAEALASQATTQLGESLKGKYLNEVQMLNEAKGVCMDMDMAYDEFYLIDSDSNPLPSSCSHVEVVTKTIAESDDMDFLDNDEIRNYKVGKTNSLYTKLNSKYYFKFL